VVDAAQPLTIRAATPSDAALLARHRVAVWLEGGNWTATELAPQVEIWTAFFEAQLTAATYGAFIAQTSERTLGSGGVLVHAAIPRPGTASERAGRIQSLYVEPAARRAGVARAIMHRLVAFAREQQLISLALHPSEQARPLYAALGFKAADEMLLRFTRG
jgi:GNAT superfamily N-acetyltransferase